MALPFAISFAVTADLALNAAAAVFGPEHLMLVPSPIGQFGVLVTAGIIVHEVNTAVVGAAKATYRWWQRRQNRHQRRRGPQPPAGA